MSQDYEIKNYSVDGEEKAEESTTTDICIPEDETRLPSVRGEDYSFYGKYTKKSGICPICSSPNHMTVNLMRAKDCMPIDEISRKIDISPDTINKHFRNHFLISKSCTQILNLKEDGSSEANELVHSIMEGDIDLYSGAQGVLEAKSLRLNIVKERIKHISDLQEEGLEEEFDVGEIINLHKVAGDLEDSILKTYQIIDKKLFPVNRTELSNAVLQYKLDVLSKLLDSIQAVFLEFENKPGYSEMITQLRQALSSKFNILEEAILKSGGVMQSQGGKKDDQ